jgi:rubredoxin
MAQRILKKYSKEKEKQKMKSYECPCGYVYDEAAGDSECSIAAGTKWDDVPDDFECPVCGLGKDMFNEI